MPTERTTITASHFATDSISVRPTIWSANKPTVKTANDTAKFSAVGATKPTTERATICAAHSPTDSDAFCSAV